jgi:hypothetical protein
MSDWMRSLTVLAMTCVGVVVLTLVLATIIVPRPAVSSQPDGADASIAPGASAGTGQPAEPEPSDGIPGLGGIVTVTGDLEGSFRLTRESLEGRYALVGSSGRMAFEGQPVEVAQASFDGWEFFTDPDQCTVTPDNLDNAIGIGFAEVVCTDLVELRDKGVVSLTATLGLPVDQLAERELPPTGGTATVGSETWDFESALLVTWQQPIISGQSEYNMGLEDTAKASRLLFTYDHVTHQLTLAAIGRDGTEADVPEGGCAIVREELGKPNPRATTVRLTITCPSVEVPGLGAVPIDSTVIVDELEWPE